MDNFKPGYKWRSLIKTDLNSTSRQLTHENNENHFLPTYFDELVIDQWFHLEMIDENLYWMRVGDYKVDIKFNGDSDCPEVYVEKEEK